MNLLAYYRYIIAGGAALTATLIPIGLQAQSTQPKDTTMNRTVVVEQEYNPDIMDAAKVNVMPKVEDPEVSKKKVEYATTLFPATTIPAGVMRSYSGTEVQPNTTPGYARIGYGNYGNLDVLANYRFRLSDKDKLNVRLQMDGMNGDLEGWDAFFYRTRANAGYTHQFDKLNLNIAGEFGLSNFNLLPEICINSKQKFTSGGVHAGVQFTDETAPLRFNVETNLLMYERQHNLLDETNFGSTVKETLLRTKGSVTGAVNDQQTVNIAVAMDNFWHNGYPKKGTGETTVDHYKNYTAILLNPYYELNADNWKLHVGANVDLSFGFDETFRISPDVTAQYVFSQSYILYAQATGGKQVNDFRRLERVCPYAEAFVPSESAEAYARPYDTYEQMNARLTFKASPYPGVWFHLFGGYQNLKNDLLYSPMAIIDESTGIIGAATCFAQADTHNLYAGGEFTYEYKDLLALTARYTYRNWDSKSGYEYLLSVKPESEFALSLQLQPVSDLRLNIGYDYIRHTQEAVALSMSDISDLHAEAAYNFYKGVSVYVRLHNLLNKDYSYFLGYPTEGFNFLGGLSVRF